MRGEEWSAVGFDLDGTLFDHHGSATAAVEHLLVHLDREPTSEFVNAWFEIEARHFESWRSGHLSFREQRRRRLRDFLDTLRVRVPDHVEAIDSLFAHYLAHYRSSWRAFDDAAPLLQRLRAQGIRLGVLTNGNRDQQLEKLQQTGLAPLIDVVCVSEEIGYAKPDRRAFEILAEQLASPITTVAYIGDNAEHDIAGARGAGMNAGLVDHRGSPSIDLEAALRSARSA